MVNDGSKDQWSFGTFEFLLRQQFLGEICEQIPRMIKRKVARIERTHLYGFLIPPVDGADFLAALVAKCFLGAFPPVDLRAVCFVLAI